MFEYLIFSFSGYIVAIVVLLWWQKRRREKMRRELVAMDWLETTQEKKEREMKEQIAALNKRFERWEIKQLGEGAGYMFTAGKKALVDRCPERLIRRALMP